MQQQIQYRPEIDGLRAIAVLAVLIFHAKLGILPGGFVGVDIFFVISGYLIASIIMHDEKREKFSLLQFYERRIRRIFPALFVVVLTSLIVGALIYPPNDFKLLGWSVFASMAFFSNLYFAKQDGYFAPTSETQPLLHTWSLGVEEQFYLVAPLVILLIHRKFYSYRTAIIAVLFLASLTASIYGAYIGSRRVFFMPHIRVFELLIGVALAMELVPKFRERWRSEIAASIGLIMIIASFFFISAQSRFPGYLALLPAVGTGLLIHSLKGSDGLIQRFLSARTMIGIGKISYSLYLWHWPLLVFAEYEFGHALTSGHRIAILIFAGLLSILTYFFVEQPVRQRTDWFGRKKIYAMGTAFIAVCALACYVIQQTDGLPQRLKPDVQLMASSITIPATNDICNLRDRKRAKVQPDVCSLGVADAPSASFILWGDSHAENVSNVLGRLAQAEGLRGLNIYNYGCPSFFGLEKFPRFMPRCEAMSEAIEKYIKDPAITDVFMSMRWAYYAELDTTPFMADRLSHRFITGDSESNRAVFARLLHETIDRLLASGKRVTIIGPAPEFPVHVPTHMIKSAMRDRLADITISRKIFDERQKNILGYFKKFERLKGINVIYPHQKFCDAELCRGSKDRTAYFVDDDHMSRDGVALFGPEMTEVLKRIKTAR